MIDVTGVVQSVEKKAVSGNRYAYEIVVGGESYGVGLFPPKCTTGDYVKFGLDDSRGYKNVGRGTLKVSKNKPPAEAVAVAAATAPQVNTAGTSFDTRQDIISRQAAMNTAIQFLTVLAGVDALGLPAGAKGNKQAALEGMLSKYTQEFYERNTGLKFKDITPVDEAKAEAAVAEFVEPQVVAEDDEWANA